MNESKSNKPIVKNDRRQSGNTSNVSTFVKREEKSYVRRYVMTEGRVRVWLENFKPGEGNAIMFPSLKGIRAEAAASDPERREKAKILIFCVGIALVLFLLLPMVWFTSTRLVIEEIRIEGNSIYSEDELLKAGGLNMGDGIPLLTANTAEAALLSNLPYVKSCNISFELPNVLIFELTDEAAAVYTEIYGEYYALSSSLKVLERSESAESFSELLYVEIPRAISAVVGEKLTLANEVDCDYICDFLELVEGSDLKNRIGIVYFDEKFDIVASVDGKFRVLFGSPSNMALKIATVSKIIEENSDACSTSGIIDVRVVDVAGIILNADIDPNVRE